ncbi:DUF2490 domain-containing protein [Chishuiella changwenlii]|uniref:DUF2490 domain-containing protein n=1 Tax=Chishuiella changwenlii TaxID=1434701 RepID=UPI002FDA50B9
MKNLKVIIIGILGLVSNHLKAQLSPPGLGKADVVQWSALGIKQDINDKWQSVTYTGWGNKSEHDRYNPLEKNAIWILNQEFYKKINDKWRYSFALSYRRQNEFETNEFGDETKDVKQEFRVYGRINYQINLDKLKITPTFRQELRRFYTSDFKNDGDDWQLRSRFRIQFAYKLDEEERHKITASAESLFSTKYDIEKEDWSEFDYNESRFTLYYSYSPKNIPAQFNIGYMNNLVGNHNPYSVNYFAFDVILTNIF